MSEGGLEPGAVLAGRYRVERAVGRGGFGEVYLGRHLVLDVPIAIKLLLAARFDDAAHRADEVKSFLAEARLLARLKHPNIVAVLDAGELETTGLPWMVLSWCDGDTLRDLVANGAVKTPMRPDDAWRLLRPAARAVAYANAEGIAHRDLKPSNLVRDHASGELVVLDFGIAKSTQLGAARPATMATRQSFSRAYAAPEQVFSGPTGAWTDVYSFALVFTELLTGKSLDDADGAAVQEHGPTPKSRGVDVGAPLEAVLSRALSLLPKHRPADVGALCQEIDGVLGVATAGPSVPPPTSAARDTALPPSTLALLKAAGARRLLIAASALFVVAIAVVVLFVWSSRSGSHHALASVFQRKPKASHAANVDRTVPIYTQASLRAAATAAGYNVLQVGGMDAGGMRNAWAKVAREPCFGMISVSDYTGTYQAHVALAEGVKALRYTAPPPYLVAVDGMHVGLIAVDSSGGPDGVCVAEAADALLPPKRR
jgi:serine/threonine-protein kinase